ncbi:MULTISPECIES: BT_3987 domain-containing protein [Arenibacter]|uniref:BT_3987 domain-containing protein n=1 Tax=Arenibacter TaxID=178469 RepID=UPI000A3C372D|nr:MULTISPECIES: DUF1735 domain-containing protein [Arenibacter]
MKKYTIVLQTLMLLMAFLHLGCEEEELASFNQNGIFISPNFGETEDFNILFMDFPSEKEISIALYKEAKEDIDVEIAYSKELIDTFNENNGTDYAPFPAENLTFSGTTAKIKKNEKSSDTLKISISTPGLDQDQIYLLPVEIKKVSSDKIELNKAMNVKYFVLKSGLPPNIALGKLTTQSSTIAGGVSSRAVDGNTSGQWGDGSVTHTGGSGEEWLQVDLGNISPFIQEIKLFNRQDCCGDRLVDFYVFVSDDPFESDSVADILLQDDVYSFFHEGVAGYETAIPVSRTGRYIRVQLTGTTNLSLAEVQVFGIE